MNKKFPFELAALAIIIAGTIHFSYYSTYKAIKQIEQQETTTHPTDSLPAKEKTDTTIVLPAKEKTDTTIVHGEMQPMFPNAYFEKDNDASGGSKGDLLAMSMITQNF